MLSFEDNGIGFAPEQLVRSLDLRPSSSDAAQMVSYHGEGLKMAAISLTQPDAGLILIFTKQGDQRTVVALDMGTQGQAQRSSLVMPPGLSYDETWDLCKWYTDSGRPDPTPIIKTLCRMPTRRGTVCYGNDRSPYNKLSDLDQVTSNLRQLMVISQGFKANLLLS